MNIKNRISKVALICCFTIINTNLFCVGNSAHTFSTQNFNSQYTYSEQPNFQEIRTTAFQSNWYHGNGVDIDITERKRQEVEFTQKFKDIFLCDSEAYLPAEKTFHEIHQTTPFNENHATGSWQYDNNDYEVNTRIQNWNYVYQKYTYIRKDTENLKKWGSAPLNIYLKNQELWPRNTDFKEIKGDVVFEKEGDKSFVYNNAHEINYNVGVNRNFHNPRYEIYGVPYSKMKENQVIWVVYNWVSRYLWSLSGNYSTVDAYAPIAFNGQKPMATFFDPKDVLSFVKCDYSRKSVTVGWNEALNESQKEILDKIKSYLRFSMTYSVSDELHPGITNNFTISLNASQLNSGYEIFLSPDENYKYHLQIKDICLKELSNSTTFVQSTNFSNVNVGSNNIVRKYDTYTLEEPKIAKVEFLDTTSGDYEKYPSEVSDETLFEHHVAVYDTYGERVLFSNISSDTYKIIRDEFNGTIMVDMHVCGEHQVATIKSFRKASQIIKDLKVSPEYEGLVADELNTECVHNTLIYNGYDPFVIDALVFNILKTDDENGIINVSAIPKNNLNFEKQNFNISGLSKYYVRSKPVNEQLAHKKPSQVSKEEVLSLLEMSDSFSRKNCDKISVKTKPNDKLGSLIVQLTYINGNSEFFFKFIPQVNYNFILIICGMFIMVLAGCFTWRYFKTPKVP